MKANKVASWDKLEKDGDFCFLTNSEGKISSLGFICPCGKCGKAYKSMIPIDIVEPKRPEAWHWDGNETEPTLTPSIQRHLDIHAFEGATGFKCEWHGYLTKGEWVSV